MSDVFFLVCLLVLTATTGLCACVCIICSFWGQVYIQHVQCTGRNRSPVSPAKQIFEISEILFSKRLSGSGPLVLDPCRLLDHKPFMHVCCWSRARWLCDVMSGNILESRSRKLQAAAVTTAFRTENDRRYCFVCLFHYATHNHHTTNFLLLHKFGASAPWSL